MTSNMIARTKASIVLAIIQELGSNNCFITLTNYTQCFTSYPHRWYTCGLKTVVNRNNVISASIKTSVFTYYAMISCYMKLTRCLSLFASQHSNSLKNCVIIVRGIQNQSTTSDRNKLRRMSS